MSDHTFLVRALVKAPDRAKALEKLLDAADEVIYGDVHLKPLAIYSDVHPPKKSELIDDEIDRIRHELTLPCQSQFIRNDVRLLLSWVDTLSWALVADCSRAILPASNGEERDTQGGTQPF